MKGKRIIALIAVVFLLSSCGVVKNALATTTTAAPVKTTTTTAETTTETTTEPAETTSEAETTTSEPVENPLIITKNPGTVSINDTALLTATGKPNTEYTLTVYYSTTASTAQGTGKATSDENGNVSWQWKVGAKTAPGEHKIIITGNGEKIETSFITVD